MNYIIHDEDSVAKYWLKMGARGWRLMWLTSFRMNFKSFQKGGQTADGDAVIIGEVWEDASRKISYDRRREYLLEKSWILL